MKTVKPKTNGGWDWSYYETFPSALAVTVTSSIEQKAAAITNWNARIDRDEFDGDDIYSLIQFLNSMSNSYNKTKLLIFTNDLDVLTHFLSGEIELETFDCNGKGIAIASWQYIELRDPKFALPNWNEFSNGSLLDKLYAFANIYMQDFVMYRGKNQKVGKLPITPHQIVETKMRKLMTKEDHLFVADLWPNKSNYYLLKQKTYIGGFCDTTTTEDLSETLGHVDFTTSYVAQAFLGYYPMSPFKPESIDNFYDSIKNKCCLIKVTFYVLKAKLMHFIGKKHIIDAEGDMYNSVGKLIYANKATFLVTELDFEILSTMYDFNDFEIEELHVADRGQLPKYVRTVAAELYAEKALAFKGTPQREVAKILTEHLYGSLISPIYGDKSWIKVKLEAVASPYWAIWMVSHARYALMTTADSLGYDFVYADTDSLFFKNPYLHVQLIETYNRNIRNSIKLYCIENNLNYDIYKDLGTFKYEENANKDHFTVLRFKSCGPKRYIYVYEKDNCDQLIRKIETKIAGYAKQYLINGEKQCVWLKQFTNEDDLFTNFTDDTKITDYQKCKYFSKDTDPMAVLNYNGRMYISKKYVITYYKKTHCSSKDKLRDALDVEAALNEHQKELGKI